MSILTLSRTGLSVNVTQNRVELIRAVHSTSLSVGGGVTVTGSGGAGGPVDWDDVTGKPTFATVATSGAYGDLSGLPALGTAATQNTTDFATAAQGVLAVTALQPGALIPWADVTSKPSFFSGAYGDLTGIPGTFTPAAHTQAWSTITSTPTTLAGYGISDAAGLVHGHADATTVAAGFMSAADKTKLNGVATGATANATDASLRDRATHTGTQAIATVTGLQAALDGKQPLATVLTNTTAAFTTAQETKLAGIATGATANSADATLLARANHTGTQLAATISDFSAAVAATAAVTANTAKVTNATHTGDVTGATALTIANDAVTNAKLANMGANTVKGAVSAGDPVDLTPAQVRTMINVADGATANASDAALRDRATHTGTQAQSTIVLAGDLAALEALTGTNTIYYRSAADTWSPVTIGANLTFTGGSLAASGGGAGTNLTYDAATRIIASDTGTDATLPLVTSGDAGLAPASGGGTTNFLRADGAWAAPAGGGGGGYDPVLGWAF